MGQGWGEQGNSVCIKICTPELGSTHLKAWCWESENFRFQIQQFAPFLNIGLLLLDTVISRAPEAACQQTLRCPANESMGVWVVGSVCN